MKKSLLILLAAITLISGCVTATQTSIRTDGIMQDYAYVVGKSGGQSFQFRLVGEGQYSYNNDKLFFVDSGAYRLKKVIPGTYHATEMSANSPSRSGRLSAGGQPLLSVFLEPGKITYVGDIRLIVSGSAPAPAPGMPDLYAGTQRSVTFTKEVQDNSDAVKSVIRKQHPELAGNLDTFFVYRPAQ